MKLAFSFYSKKKIDELALSKDASSEHNLVRTTSTG